MNYLASGVKHDLQAQPGRLGTDFFSLAGLNLTEGFLGKRLVKAKYIGEPVNNLVFKNRVELIEYIIND